MHIKSLLQTITNKLALHNSRKETFISIVLSLIDPQNVQHHAFCKHLPCKEATLLKSKLERIRRFFKYQEIDLIVFAKALLTTFFPHQGPTTPPFMHLLLDRTNWKFGRQNINYLVLSVRLEDHPHMIFPLFWTLLDHQGNSDAKERIALLDCFQKAFGFECIASFTADREVYR